MRAPDLRWIAHGSPAYAALIELRRAVLRKPLGLDFTPDQLSEESRQLHLGAWEGDVPLGCLTLLVDGGTARMRQVAVSPEARGNGIGRRLVLESEAEARRRGAVRMILHARQTAVAFYERLGYGVDGKLFAEIGLPHRRMSKTLADDSI
jgi:ribosomal protein S18 acetylase RimI-like enzyme